MTTATAEVKTTKYDKETFKWLYGGSIDGGCKLGGYRLKGFKIRTMKQDCPYVGGKKIAILTSSIYGKTAYCADESGNHWSTSLLSSIEETAKYGCFMEII